MFRRILVAMALLYLALSSAHAADTWVSFHSATPADVKTVLVEADDYHAVYRITVPGMWVREADGQTYQLLECTPSFKDTVLGVPSLPVIPANLALPTGATMSVSIAQGRKLTLSDYYAAPVPRVEIKYDHGMASFDEYYEANSSIYSDDKYYPGANYQLRSDEGFFVTQQVGGVDIWPIRFNPVKQELEVTDTLTVTVAFQGGSGSAVQELGMFNAATHGTLINSTQPVIPIHLPGPGSVQWVTAADSVIDCDYLIVIPDQIWTGLERNAGFDDQVRRFADMRASLSGFDVRIVRAATTVDVTPEGCIPRGPADTDHGRIAWKGIRDYVRAVFERGHGYHTGTGRLGFVLLIGDARDEDGYADSTLIGVDDWLIPSPRPITYDENQNGGDHWYACLTHAGNTFDEVEDVALGRFPVGNPWELTDMVDKMFAYSVSPGDRHWTNNVLNIAGPNAYPTYQRPWFHNAACRETAYGYDVKYAYCYPWAGDPQEPCYTSLHEMQLAGPWSVRAEDTQYIADRVADGAWIMGYFGHGVENRELGFNVYSPYNLFIGADPPVQNPDRLHFVVDVSCANAWIDPIASEFIDCDGHPSPFTWFDGCAELATIKSHYGAISWIGSARTIGAGAAPNMYDKFTESVLDFGNGLAGIGFLRYKVSADPLTGKRLYHNMGDPALDLYSNPVSGDVTEDVTWCGRTVIGQNTTVHAGATLTLCPGAEVILLNGATLDVQGRLIAEGTSGNRINIHGTIGQKTGQLKFTNSNGTAPWNRIKYCDFYSLDVGVRSVNSTVTIEASDFENTNFAMRESEGGTLTIQGYNVFEKVNIDGGTCAVSSGAITVLRQNCALTVAAGAQFSANGTSEEQVVFGAVTGATGTSVSLYGGTQASPLIFANCIFQGVWLPIYARGSSYTTLSNCIFTECPVGMLISSSGTIIADACEVSVTGQYGIVNLGRLEMTGGSIQGAYRAGVWGANLSSELLEDIVITDNGDGEDNNLYYGGVRNTFSQLTLKCVENTGNHGPGLTCLGGFTFMGSGGHDGSAKNCFQDNLPRGDMPRTQIYFSGYSWFDMCNGRNRVYAEDGALIIDAMPDRMPDVSGNNFGGREDDPGALPEGYWWNQLDPDETCHDRCGIDNYGRCLDSEASALYAQAMGLEFDMFYADAIILYQTILTDFPGSPEAKLCPDRITTCEKYLPANWTDRQTYFLSVADTTTDRDLNYECRSSAAWCLVELGNFEAAQDTFLVLMDEFDENYKYEKTSLLDLLAEIKEAPWEGLGIQSVGGTQAADRTMDILEEMEQILSGKHSGRGTITVPERYALYQNYPNPFNPLTEIRFDLPEQAHVELTVFNTLGQRVTTLINEARPAGAYHMAWDGAAFASGVYLYQLKAGDFVSTKKMVLIR